VSKLASAFVFAFRLLLGERLPPPLAGPDSVERASRCMPAAGGSLLSKSATFQ